MASSKLRSRKLSPKQEAAYFISACKDKDGLYVKYINSYKGRGVYSRFHFERGDFLLEYRGQLISRHECESRQKIYHDALKVFMFEFYFNGKLFCIDAARDDGSLGRLVNDDHVSPNSKMKKITISGKPHLCLFATRSISPGEEITYNYGDSDWPWRCKVATEKDQLHPKEQSTSSENITDVGMTTNVQLLPEGQHADVLREETEEAVSEGDPCANTLMDNSSLSKEMEQNITDVGMTTNVQLFPEGQHADVLREETEEVATKLDFCKTGGHRSSFPNENVEKQPCKHEVIHANFSSMDKCSACFGPVAPLKWIGLRCKVCSKFWHKNCFAKFEKNDEEPLSWMRST
ncbi:histone-lysine N-methyltransferase SETD5-like isoform X10 [Brienomyrus brachyistius]|uniref:histone-lysine N-methyltransferase SETD5-like isoform X10 n=1 Tax=Brienomyrus brachyistius TaxID=42636 RepID=UPI0020B3A180|nr:histone-lysine N-methyltransferase SETD5-like isoform X10 [Brienomyrus brachyistius]